jgi:hypothetical protein
MISAFSLSHASVIRQKGRRYLQAINSYCRYGDPGAFFDFPLLLSRYCP